MPNLKKNGFQRELLYFKPVFSEITRDIPRPILFNFADQKHI